MKKAICLLVLIMMVAGLMSAQAEVTWNKWVNHYDDQWSRQGTDPSEPDAEFEQLATGSSVEALTISGWTKRIKDEKGNVTTHSYDADDHLISSVLEEYFEGVNGFFKTTLRPDGNVDRKERVLYTYDEKGNVVSSISYTIAAYDENNRQVQMSEVLDDGTYISCSISTNEDGSFTSTCSTYTSIIGGTKSDGFSVSYDKDGNFISGWIFNKDTNSNDRMENPPQEDPMKDAYLKAE